MNGLDCVINHFGGPAKLAGHIGVVPMTISHWRRRGVPANRVLELAEATNWEVTPHEIAPDLYPHPEDGLPLER